MYATNTNIIISLSGGCGQATLTDSVTAETSSQVAIGLPELMKKVLTNSKRTIFKPPQTMKLMLQDLVVDVKATEKNEGKITVRCLSVVGRILPQTDSS